MCDLLIFGGTTEGRRIADYCEHKGFPAYLSVVSDYGREILPDYQYIKVLEGAMDCDAIKTFIIENEIRMVIDATHPFAKVASDNIRKAASDTKIRMYRLLRSGSGEKTKNEDGILFVNSISEASDYLMTNSGNILITTGSKELSQYTGIPDFSKRTYIRILPNASMIEKCESLGILSSHICAMQGPFSKEFNIAHIQAVCAEYLITKESGKNGGFDEKIEAARECGIKAIVIRKPEEAGHTFEEICTCIDQEISIICNESSRRESCTKENGTISLVGIGPGDEAYLTQKAKERCQKADVVIGAKRMLELGRKVNQKADTVFLNSYKSDEIMDIIKRYRGKTILVLYSGDTGFYSGSNTLAKALKKEKLEFEIIPGISSFQYLAAKVSVSYEDAQFFSAHGREFDDNSLKECEKAFVLTGGENGAGVLLSKLAASGYGDWYAYVGQQLSYPDENITEGKASELAKLTYTGLAVLLLLKTLP